VLNTTTLTLTSLFCVEVEGDKVSLLNVWVFKLSMIHKVYNYEGIKQIHPSKVIPENNCILKH
jgi:hypothetical protein